MTLELVLVSTSRLITSVWTIRFVPISNSKIYYSFRLNVATRIPPHLSLFLSAAMPLEPGATWAKSRFPFERRARITPTTRMFVWCNWRNWRLLGFSVDRLPLENYDQPSFSDFFGVVFVGKDFTYRLLSSLQRRAHYRGNRAHGCGGDAQGNRRFRGACRR